MAFCIPGGRYWRKWTGGLAFGIPGVPVRYRQYPPPGMPKVSAPVRHCQYPSPEILKARAHVCHCQHPPPELPKVNAPVRHRQYKQQAREGNANILARWVIGEGGLEHWLLVSLVGDIDEGGLEDGLSVSLVGDIGEGGLEDWLSVSLVGDIREGGLEDGLSVSLVGDIGEGGLEDWLSVSLVGDIGEGGLEHDVGNLPHVMCCFKHETYPFFLVESFSFIFIITESKLSISSIEILLFHKH
ncbi:hypothetical protein PoB_002579900 [Plakobranchus ocellatus]|uniref:Uncharacterized protein n=1 Tax=Plakobranchus ocellatus TaxID=259542 RepID=A0AAV3ZZC8_9GAST|nr:hypothetical protein PoB_002579900 [Plakobranchus ocellatus]